MWGRLPTAEKEERKKMAVSSHFFQLFVIFCHFSVSFGKLFLVYFRLFWFILVLSRPCDCLSLTYFAHFYPRFMQKTAIPSKYALSKGCILHEEMSSFLPELSWFELLLFKKRSELQEFLGLAPFQTNLLPTKQSQFTRSFQLNAESAFEAILRVPSCRPGCRCPSGPFRRGGR